MNESTEKPSSVDLSSAPSSEILVSLRMRGSKRNSAKVQRMVACAIQDKLENMSWKVTDMQGKVDVQWDIFETTEQLLNTGDDLVLAIEAYFDGNDRSPTMQICSAVKEWREQKQDAAKSGKPD